MKRTENGRQETVGLSKRKKTGLCAALCLCLALSVTGCIKQPPAADESGQTAEDAYRNDVSVESLKAEAAEALGENYWPNMTLGAEEMDSLMGIKAELYEEAVAEMPMISTNVDTLIIVKAKEDRIRDVEEAVNAYRENLVNDTMQYPMNLGKIQASMVKTFGNYVCFVQLGGDAVEESDEEAAIRKCQEANQEALNAIENALKEA